MKKVRRVLQTAVEGYLPACVRRRAPMDESSMFGWVVGLSKRWVLFHEIDGDTLWPNGYVALRVKDVRRAALLGDHWDGLWGKVIALRGLVPVPQPDVLLVDLPGLLSSANSAFPLINVLTEDLYPDECYVGRVRKISARSLHLDEMTPAAKWEEKSVRYKLKDITSVEFGGGYLDALWQVSQQESRLA